MITIQPNHLTGPWKAGYLVVQVWLLIVSVIRAVLQLAKIQLMHILQFFFHFPDREPRRAWELEQACTLISVIRAVLHHYNYCTYKPSRKVSRSCVWAAQANTSSWICFSYLQSKIRKVIEFNIFLPGCRPTGRWRRTEASRPGEGFWSARARWSPWNEFRSRS